MTIKEAIGQLKCNVEGDYINLDDLEAFNLAIPALEKQIPKKVVPTQQPCKSRFACSICDKRLYSKQKFCDRCGQALDWSDTE